MTQDFWNSRYHNTDPEKLGWYEATPQPSLNLIREFSTSKQDLILDIGSGSSTLIDHLIEDGFNQIIASDISNEGLDLTKKRLGDKASGVRFICDDILHSTALNQLQNISIWHDRAVLHFFTDEKDRQAYLNLLKKILKPSGFVIISTFAIGGLTKCSGLEIKQYDAMSLSKFLGSEFKLIRTFSHIYTTTWGQERPFLYVVFQRIWDCCEIPITL